MLLHTLHLHFQELLTDSLIKRRKPVEFLHEMLREEMLYKHLLLQTVAFNYPSFGCARKSTLHALYQSVIWHADIYQGDYKISSTSINSARKDISCVTSELD